MAALLEDFAAILRSGRLTMGPYLERFEQEFAACVGAGHAVGMSSGTAPLEIALRYWGIEGREVVVPTNTFIASSNAALLAGGQPVLCDIDPQTLSSGLPQIEAQVGEKTRAVVAVHIAGLIAPDIEDIRSFCRARGLLLLEDAAHAHGASADGKPAGSLGDAAAFSFFPTKPLTTGEGAHVEHQRPRFGRLCAEFPHAWGERTGPLVGAFGQQLPLARTERSASACGNWRDWPSTQPSATASPPATGTRSGAWGAARCSCRNSPAEYTHITSSLCACPAGKKREWVVAQLRERWGIEAGSVYWPPCHLTPFYQRELGYGPGDFPVAEEVLAQVVSLPMFPGLSDEAVERVCCSLAEILAATEGDCRDDK